jgi:hypothetical protein
MVDEQLPAAYLDVAMFLQDLENPYGCCAGAAGASPELLACDSDESSFG